MRLCSFALVLALLVASCGGGGTKTPIITIPDVYPDTAVADLPVDVEMGLDGIGEPDLPLETAVDGTGDVADAAGIDASEEARPDATDVPADTAPDETTVGPLRLFGAFGAGAMGQGPDSARTWSAIGTASTWKQ